MLLLVVVVGVDGVDGNCGGLFMVCVCLTVSLLTLVLLVVGIVSCDWIVSKFVRLGVGGGSRTRVIVVLYPMG